MDMPNNDLGGALRFLTDELQAAEDAGERGAHLFVISFCAAQICVI